jgi:hypothetical protein
MEQYYNPQTRECRNCSFQNSCRDNIIRSRQATPGYYTQFATNGYAGPVPAPAPINVAQAPLPVVAQQQQVVRQPPPQQPMSAFPPPAPYSYGWLHDPLYYALYSAPPPMVPQLEGEGFLERMGKNMVRSMVTGVTGEAFLAARQWVWAPKKNEPSNGGGREE